MLGMQANSPAAPTGFDVLGLGCVAVDDLLYAPSYPAADSKLRILRRERQGGGLTATALVAAARLGAHCGYAGQLGFDEFSEFAIQVFAREGVDVSWAPRTDDARVIPSVIVVAEDTGSRTILYHAEGRIGAHETLPPAGLIAASRVLFIDHYGVAGGRRAAAIARAAGRPVVADFEAVDPAPLGGLMHLVDHLIVSRGFAERATRFPNPADAARALWRDHRAVVVVTCGEAGAWVVSIRHPGVARHFPAYQTETVDTTGCGDVFHGAYAAALAAGLEIDERLRFAAAAAALKAARRGGQFGIPDRAAVMSFLAEAPRTHPASLVSAKV